MNLLSKRTSRMVSRCLRKNPTVKMSKNILELLGVRRSRSNSSMISAALLGAGAMAYSMKKMMNNQQGAVKNKPNSPAKTNLSPERKSAIKNMLRSYSKNDPGLRKAMQEFSSELGTKDIENTQKSSNLGRD
jgi:hypothetical protein